MCHHHAIPYLSLAPLHFNVLLKKFQFILLISSNFLLGPYSTPTHNSRHLLLLLKYLLIFYFTFFIFSFSLQYITVSDQLWKFVCANFLIIILDLILSSTKRYVDKTPLQSKDLFLKSLTLLFLMMRHKLAPVRVDLYSYL